MFRGFGRDIGWQAAQGLEVGGEGSRVFLGHGPGAAGLLAGPLDDLIVDVRDILNVGDPVSPAHQHPAQHVKDHEGTGVAHVEVVVHGRPAGIQAHMLGLGGLEALPAPGGGIEKKQARFFFRLQRFSAHEFSWCRGRSVRQTRPGSEL